MIKISELKKKIPKDQMAWVEIKKEDSVYLISSDSFRSKYFIYKQVEDGLEKLGTGSSPIELEEKFVWK